MSHDHPFKFQLSAVAQTDSLIEQKEKTMKNLIVVLWMIVCGFSLTAEAEKLVFVSNEFPPYTMSQEGQASGIHVDIIREFCTRNGIEPEIRIVPWARALMEVKEGDAIGIFPAVKTDERTGFLWYPSEPLGSDKNVIVMLKGTGENITTLDDLKQKTVGVVRGYSYSPEFDTHQGVKKDESVDDAMMLRKLAEGRTEFAVGEEGNLQFLSLHIGIELETALILFEDPNYVAFSKASGKQGQALADTFAQTMRQFRKEGVIEHIIARYIGANE